MDGRRLGMGIGLPRAFLEAAAPGYLTSAEWDAQEDDWLEQALDYAAEDCQGVRGPLTRIRPLPGRLRVTGPPAGDPGDPAGWRPYRLADYLDQYGRQHRNSRFPPAGFWAAAADHASPADQAALSDAADARGLYRDATQLRKNAAASGNFSAARGLAIPRDYLRSDVRPMRLAIAHMPVDDSYAVPQVLYGLHAMGAADQVTALAERAAAEFPLDDPYAVRRLLDSLLAVGAAEQAIALADRALAYVPFNDPSTLATLLNAMWEAGAAEQAIALGMRVAAHFPFSYSPASAVTRLLEGLREIGQTEQALALAERAAARVSPDDLDTTTALAADLREAGATDQATALADRAVAHFPLDDPGAVHNLLSSLLAAGAAEQAGVLVGRLPGAGLFDVFCRQEGNQNRFGFGREPDGSPAGPWGWGDLD